MKISPDCERVETPIQPPPKQTRFKASTALQWLRERTGNSKLEDRTAPGITKCVISYITLLSGYASEIDNRGFWNKELQLFTKSKTENGFPDIAIVLNGRFIGAEIKAARDRMFKDQYKVAAKIRAAKGFYVEVRDFEGFYEFIELRRRRNERH